MNVKASIPRASVGQILKKRAGGTQSSASIAVIDGEKRFVKSQHLARHNRYANFESDILAHDLFELADIKAPKAEIMTLPPGELAQELGQTVLVTEFVDTNFAGDTKVLHGASWELKNGAVLDDYLKMTIVDILQGNADRRDANFMDRVLPDGTIRPAPIDNDSALGNLVTQKFASNHCNFIKSYGPSGKARGIRQCGSLANLFVDSVWQKYSLDEPHEQARALELAKEYTAKLTDKTIDSMVEALPPEIIPPDVKLEFGEPSADFPESVGYLLNGATNGLQGRELFEFRKSQIKDTLKWRRDHLVGALKDFFQQLNDPQKDPMNECFQDWYAK